MGLKSKRKRQVINAGESAWSWVRRAISKVKGVRQEVRKCETDEGLHGLQTIPKRNRQAKGFIRQARVFQIDRWLKQERRWKE